MKTLLLAGGAHAHLEVLRRFGLERPGDARAGHYRWEECHVGVARYS